MNFIAWQTISASFQQTHLIINEKGEDWSLSLLERQAVSLPAIGRFAFGETPFLSKDDAKFGIPNWCLCDGGAFFGFFSGERVAAMESRGKGPNSLEAGLACGSPKCSMMVFT